MDRTARPFFSLEPSTDALLWLPNRSEEFGWILHMSSIFWNLERFPIQGAGAIARCRLRTEDGDAEQNDAAGRQEIRRIMVPSRIDL
jgi:hypothetical protein